MPDVLQIILVVTVVMIAILLIILGIQVFLLIKEIRFGIQKVSTLVDKAHTVTDNIASPFTTLSSLLKETSVVTIIKLLKTVLAKEKEKSKE